MTKLKGAGHPGCMGRFRPGFKQILQATREFAVQHTKAVSAKELHAHITHQYGVDVSSGVCYRALEEVAAEKPTFAESIPLLPSLVEQLRAEDEQGTFSLVQHDDLTFRGVFIMPSGFARLAATCKPVLAIDCAHLRNSWHTGRIMFIVTQDAQRHNVLVALAIVDSENCDNYMWALEQLQQNELLKQYLEHPDLTVISDRAKGLISAVQHALPAAAHLHCTRHIIGNVRDHVHKSGGYFDNKKHAGHIWKAQGAESQEQFEEAMSALRAENPVASQYLANVDPSTWAAHAFPRCLYGLRTNNMVEQMNSATVPERELECLVDMIKRIIWKVLKKIEGLELEARSFEGTCCPLMSEVLQEQQELAARYNCTKASSGRGIYEAMVHCEGNRYSHSVSSRPDERRVRIQGDTFSCTCRFPQSTKLPCRHVIAVCTSRMAKEYGVVANELLKVPRIFTVENYVQGYTNMTVRLPEFRVLEPSTSIRVPALPAPADTKRKKPKYELLEEKQSKKRRGVTCGNCGRFGHTKRSCQRVARTEADAVAALDSQPTRSGASSTASSPTTPPGELRPEQQAQLEVMRQSTLMLQVIREALANQNTAYQL